jgi:hypothetical protein
MNLSAIRAFVGAGLVPARSDQRSLKRRAINQRYVIAHLDSRSRAAGKDKPCPYNSIQR